MACLEEPIASSSIVPMYFVCQRAREDVKVALVGQGPDELFGGYRRHLGVRYGALWGGLPGWMRSAVGSVTVAALPRNEMLKRGLHSLDVPRIGCSRYQNVLSLLPGDRNRWTVSGRNSSARIGRQDPRLPGRTWRELMNQTDELGGLQFLELRSTLPDELLMYADKLSMAHSLEFACPFLIKRSWNMPNGCRRI